MVAKKSVPAFAVLARPAYLLLFLVITISFFSFNVLLPNLGFLLKSFGQYSFFAYVTLFFSLFQGGLDTLPTHTIVLTAIISVLTGLVVALIAFKVRVLKGQSLAGTKTATLGALFGLAVPACAACGLGLLSLVGLGGAVASLPFQGTEVAVLSIVLLSFAMFHLNKNIGSCSSCQIDLKKFEKKN